MLFVQDLTTDLYRILSAITHRHRIPIQFGRLVVKDFIVSNYGRGYELEAFVSIYRKDRNLDMFHDQLNVSIREL